MKLCFLCGKKIGLLRSLVDQQYCSPEHRKEARLASSQAYRDEDDNEQWAIAKRNKKGQLGKPAGSVGQNASVIVFLAVGGLLVLALMLPGPGPGAAFPSVSHDPAVKRGLLERVSDSFTEMVRSSAPITLQHDFSKGMEDWSSVAVRTASNIDDPRDWIGGTRAQSSNVSPNRPLLRIWDRSATMQNYQMEFQARLDHKSLSWAYRASDGGNYYGSKISILKSGSGPNAQLIRSAFVGGREVEHPAPRPLGIALVKGTDYRIRVTVQDEHFTEFLNGQVIGNWTDKNLSHGGVGFVDDPNDPQKVAWVSVSERDSFLGRMLAHFSLFVMPGTDPLR